MDHPGGKVRQDLKCYIERRLQNCGTAWCRHWPVLLAVSGGRKEKKKKKKKKEEEGKKKEIGLMHCFDTN